tara:strand:- start:877 stop:1020 length:144 start_codon:yes stop_codon:yes gene_type:complete
MTVERNIHGYIVITDFIDSYYVTRKYMDYTKKEAIQRFKEEFNLKES